MSIKAIAKDVSHFVQLALDKEYGEGKAHATQKGAIKFNFPTTHHGCNEMEIGAWRLNKGKITILVSMDYTEAYEHLKAGTKPRKDEVIALDPNAFNFKPKDIA
jgi:hypothetical protein